MTSLWCLLLVQTLLRIRAWARPKARSGCALRVEPDSTMATGWAKTHSHSLSEYDDSTFFPMRQLSPKHQFRPRALHGVLTHVSCSPFTSSYDYRSTTAQRELLPITCSRDHAVVPQD
ncbi:hypothetical protein DE146DRAFT_205546 [Phaeosphaeria sp. MPI-PUGE-AT-0046c]|nr:hypothetical protein DE146DRAFT_205546 [Phaeosphaeria sp. MPI-PUGE-AT-0046c]